MTIHDHLISLKDSGYADFQSALLPGISSDVIIGVRVPELRKLAKTISDDPDCQDFLKDLPHAYYDENMLHAILISRISGFTDCMNAVNRFLPYVDNWAVCDCLSPRIFRSNHSALLDAIKIWISSSRPYTCRFGVEMLMVHFLDSDFLPEYLKLPASVRSKEYYVNMMISWFFATALARQWDSSLPYLMECRLDPWVHNKTIQKAIESYRIPEERKAFLKTLRIRKNPS